MMMINSQKVPNKGLLGDDSSSLSACSTPIILPHSNMGSLQPNQEFLLKLKSLSPEMFGCAMTPDVATPMPHPLLPSAECKMSPLNFPYQSFSERSTGSVPLNDARANSLGVNSIPPEMLLPSSGVPPQIQQNHVPTEESGPAGPYVVKCVEHHKDRTLQNMVRFASDSGHLLWRCHPNAPCKVRWEGRSAHQKQREHREREKKQEKARFRQQTEHLYAQQAICQQYQQPLLTEQQLQQQQQQQQQQLQWQQQSMFIHCPSDTPALALFMPQQVIGVPLHLSAPMPVSVPGTERGPMPWVAVSPSSGSSCPQNSQSEGSAWPGYNMHIV